MTGPSSRRRAWRAGVLNDCGAPPAIVDELLAYGDAPAGGSDAPPTLPLPDEPHVEAWLAYEGEAREIGAVEALRRHFVQLRFPIREGLSAETAYARATRRGDFAAAAPFAPGLQFQAPDEIALTVQPTMGGRVPVLVAGERSDFTALVRAFTARNEPADVPDSMGACLVRGLNNWSRIAAYRRHWAESRGGDDETAWADEFRALVPRKAQYQDRLVILSRGPYSAVDAASAALSQREWLARSLVIRREHECTHYFTYRCLGSLRSHALDELVADFVGLVHAFGRYDADRALRFLGLEAYPDYRADGRLENYWTQARLSSDARGIVRTLVVRAARNLERIGRAVSPSPDRLADLGRLVFRLSRLSLEELGSNEAVALATG
jgi:hypothetical protein